MIISPYKPSHLTVSKGKWVYIGAQSNGGFVDKKPGSHTFAGPAAISHIGRINSDIKNGKIKKSAPPAQLYDLENDPYQTKNVLNKHPEIAKEIQVILKTYKDELKIKKNKK